MSPSTLVLLLVLTYQVDAYPYIAALWARCKENGISLIKNALHSPCVLNIQPMTVRELQDEGWQYSTHDSTIGYLPDDYQDGNMVQAVGQGNATFIKFVKSPGDEFDFFLPKLPAAGLGTLICTATGEETADSPKWSDFAIAAWSAFAPGRDLPTSGIKSVLWVMVKEEVSNDMSLEVFDRAYHKDGNFYYRPLMGQSVELPYNTMEYQVLLGSAVGRATLYLLYRNRPVLGMKNITSIKLWYGWEFGVSNMHMNWQFMFADSH